MYILVCGDPAAEVARNHLHWARSTGPAALAVPGKQQAVLILNVSSATSTLKLLGIFQMNGLICHPAHLCCPAEGGRRQLPIRLWHANRRRQGLTSTY